MASAPSFDIVSKVDRQEVDNALNQAEKELSTRFDFRGTGAEVKWGKGTRAYRDTKSAIAEGLPDETAALLQQTAVNRRERRLVGPEVSAGRIEPPPSREVALVIRRSRRQCSQLVVVPAHRGRHLAVPFLAEAAANLLCSALPF